MLKEKWGGGETNEEYQRLCKYGICKEDFYGCNEDDFDKLIDIDKDFFERKDYKYCDGWGWFGSVCVSRKDNRMIYGKIVWLAEVKSIDNHPSSHFNNPLTGLSQGCINNFEKLEYNAAKKYYEELKSRVEENKENKEEL